MVPDRMGVEGVLHTIARFVAWPVPQFPCPTGQGERDDTRRRRTPRRARWLCSHGIDAGLSRMRGVEVTT